MSQDEIVSDIKRVGRGDANAPRFFDTSRFDVLDEPHRATTAESFVNFGFSSQPERFDLLRQANVQNISVSAIRNRSAIGKSRRATFGRTLSPIGYAAQRAH